VVPANDFHIISLYARGLSTREIQQNLEEIYHVEVSAGLISNVTNEVIEEVKTWQNRQLDEVYPIVYMDAIQFKVRDSGHVKNKAVYLAIGMTMDGLKEVLGLWIAQTEGAKFWLQVVTELKNRGVKDILIACVDGLKGFPEAIESVFPQTVVQLCIVHLVRHSLNYVNWKERKEVAHDLKTIYTSATDVEAQQKTGGVQQEVGREVSHDCKILAQQLGTGHSIFRPSGGDPPGDLYDQRNRVFEYVAAQSDESARLVS